MKQSCLSPLPARTRPYAALLLGGVFAFSACNAGDSAPLGTTAGPAGSVALHPDQTIRSQYFIVEENQRGNAGQVELLGLFTGRLVDVQDESGVVRQTDYVIGQDIRTDSVYEISTNPVTQKTSVRIKHAVSTPEYIAALQRLDLNLTPIADKSLDPGELPPFSPAERNSALVLRLSDMLNPRFVSGAWRDSYNNNLVNAESGQINSQAVRLLTDYPPEQPFETRTVVDRNHGDWADSNGDGVTEFHPTRIIMALTVTEVDSASSDPPLPVNTLGLPKAITTSEPNAVVRIPTKLDPTVGQTQLLTNSSEAPLGFNSNGSNDPESPTLDVIRAFRSGGDSDTTGDLNNGFLPDQESPRIMGRLPVTLVGTPTQDPQVEGGWIVPQTVFEIDTCATQPDLDDVLVQGETRALVTGFDAQNGTTILGLRVQVVSPVGGAVAPGQAQLISPFNPALDNPACYVRFSPGAITPPSQGVSKAARVVVLFSEPMDPSTLTAFDSLSVLRTEVPQTAFDLVVGQIVPSSNLTEFVFEPRLEFSHQFNSAEQYYVRVTSGAQGPTDLAGNPLQAELPVVSFLLDPAEGTGLNGGFALRFASPDELYEDGWPELRSGQVLFNLTQQLIQPRPVNRFPIAADVDKPVPSAMAAFPQGVQTPLSPLGSKLQTLWRYMDVGFSATDETNINIDVEGLAWTPNGSSVVSDAYDEFSIRLGHSAWLPDEVLNGMTGFPNWPNSGLVKTFANNWLSSGSDQAIVHPRDRGYVVNPADLFTSESGKLMMPWPMNQGIPIEEFTYYTWRDTAILQVAGFSNIGVPTGQEANILGPPVTAGSDYLTGMIPTLGLPLLMEFRCYPDDSGLGLNAFEIALAVNSSSRPNFRAFSTGGTNTSNQPTPVNPDLSNEATGGFNPGSSPPGQATPGLDSSFYHGQLDLITRVSRIHTIWFDTTFSAPDYAPPVIEPGPEVQPSGTSAVLAFRGATLINGADTMGNPPDDISTNAADLDAYGNPTAMNTSGTAPGSPTFFNNDGTWKDDISDIDGAKLFQVRISFVSNPISNKTAQITSLGFAYSQGL